MKRTLTTMLVALALATPFASADVYEWTGTGGDTLWTTLANWSWDVDGNTPTSTPGVGDTTVFDTTGAKNFTVTAIPGDTNLGFLQLKGNGNIEFTSTGRITTTSGFEALDSVNLTLTGSNTLFYPNKDDVGETVYTTWDSSGTFTTLGKDLDLFYNNSGASMLQTAGTVLSAGSRMLGRTDCFYYVDGGLLQTTALFGNTNQSRNADGAAIVLRGGDLTEAGNMAWNGMSDVTIEDGTFTVGGKITFNSNDVTGHLNFATGSTGSFVSEHEIVDIQDFIDDGHIVIDGVAATPGDYSDFSIVKVGDITTVTLVPEPATMSLLALGGMAMLKRRKNKKK